MAGNNLAEITTDGNLTNDPEYKVISTGTPVVKFTIAVNDDEEVSFFDVEAWGKLAENCRQYITKGSKVTVLGKLKQQRWKTPEGENRSKIFIKARSVRFDFGGKTSIKASEGEEPSDF